MTTTLRELAIAAQSRQLDDREAMRLVTAVMALEKIAAYPSGGRILDGTPACDRHDMIQLARGAFGPGLRQWIPATTAVDPA